MVQRHWYSMYREQQSNATKVMPTSLSRLRKMDGTNQFSSGNVSSAKLFKEGKLLPLEAASVVEWDSSGEESTLTKDCILSRQKGTSFRNQASTAGKPSLHPPACSIYIIYYICIYIHSSNQGKFSIYIILYVYIYTLTYIYIYTLRQPRKVCGQCLDSLPQHLSSSWCSLINGRLPMEIGS